MVEMTVKKVLPKEITSYDLLKAFAVIIMIIDHIGFYLFPEQNAWRAVGRIGFPIWFFLVGYARSRDFSLKLWAGAIILVLSNIVFGMYIFPLNALFTIIIIRVMIDAYIKLSMANMQGFVAFSFVLFVLALPTNMITEYGTIALIMAVFGYLVRNRKTIKNEDAILNGYMLFALLGFLFTQFVVFDFSQALMIVTIIGTLAVMAVLFIFKSVTYPKLTQNMPRVICWLIQLLGRRTLEIYVVHLVILKLASVILYPDLYQFFNWTLSYQAPEEIPLNDVP